MIGSRNHFGGDRPIRAGQASPPGGTEGGERKEHVRSRLLKKGGHIFVQGRLLWWWGTTSVETSPLPRGPPPSCLKVAHWQLCSRAQSSGRSIPPPLACTTQDISRHISACPPPYPPSFPMALSTGPEVWEDSCLTDHRCANHLINPWCQACIISSGPKALQQV
jgi:hypothetical protein